MTLAQNERAELSELFVHTGPDAPTLCGEWRTKDLAAHLVLREQRMDAAPGIALPFLSSYTESVQSKLADKPWAELVNDVRDGPPWWSPWSLPLMDKHGNGLEFFVHHEDVRRAQPGWQPRPADASRYAALQATLARVGKLLYRRSRVSVRLQVVGGKYVDVRTIKGAEMVTVTGTPDELVLHAFGRDDHAQVDISGNPVAIRTLAKAPRGI